MDGGGDADLLGLGSLPPARNVTREHAFSTNRPDDGDDDGDGAAVDYRGSIRMRPSKEGRGPQRRRRRSGSCEEVHVDRGTKREGGARRRRRTLDSGASGAKGLKRKERRSRSKSAVRKRSVEDRNEPKTRERRLEGRARRRRSEDSGAKGPERNEGRSRSKSAARKRSMEDRSNPKTMERRSRSRSAARKKKGEDRCEPKTRERRIRSRSAAQRRNEEDRHEPKSRERRIRSKSAAQRRNGEDRDKPKTGKLPLSRGMSDGGNNGLSRTMSGGSKGNGRFRMPSRPSSRPKRLGGRLDMKPVGRQGRRRSFDRTGEKLYQGSSNRSGEKLYQGSSNRTGEKLYQGRMNKPPPPQGQQLESPGPVYPKLHDQWGEQSQPMPFVPPYDRLRNKEQAAQRQHKQQLQQQQQTNQSSKGERLESPTSPQSQQSNHKLKVKRPWAKSTPSSPLSRKKTTKETVHPTKTSAPNNDADLSSSSKYLSSSSKSATWANSSIFATYLAKEAKAPAEQKSEKEGSQPKSLFGKVAPWARGRPARGKPEGSPEEARPASSPKPGRKTSQSFERQDKAARGSILAAARPSRSFLSEEDLAAERELLLASADKSLSDRTARRLEEKRKLAEDADERRDDRFGEEGASSSSSGKEDAPPPPPVGKEPPWPEGQGGGRRRRAPGRRNSSAKRLDCNMSNSTGRSFVSQREIDQLRNGVLDDSRMSRSLLNQEDSGNLPSGADDSDVACGSGGNKPLWKPNSSLSSEDDVALDLALLRTKSRLDASLKDLERKATKVDMRTKQSTNAAAGRPIWKPSSFDTSLRELRSVAEDEGDVEARILRRGSDQDLRDTGKRAGRISKEAEDTLNLPKILTRTREDDSVSKGSIATMGARIPQLQTTKDDSTAAEEAGEGPVRRRSSAELRALEVEGEESIEYVTKGQRRRTLESSMTNLQVRMLQAMSSGPQKQTPADGNSVKTRLFPKRKSEESFYRFKEGIEDAETEQLSKSLNDSISQKNTANGAKYAGEDTDLLNLDEGYFPGDEKGKNGDDDIKKFMGLKSGSGGNLTGFLAPKKKGRLPTQTPPLDDSEREDDIKPRSQGRVGRKNDHANTSDASLSSKDTSKGRRLLASKKKERRPTQTTCASTGFDDSQREDDAESRSQDRADRKYFTANASDTSLSSKNSSKERSNSKGQSISKGRSSSKGSSRTSKKYKRRKDADTVEDTTISSKGSSNQRNAMIVAAEMGEVSTIGSKRSGSPSQSVEEDEESERYEEKKRRFDLEDLSLGFHVSPLMACVLCTCYCMSILLIGLLGYGIHFFAAQGDALTSPEQDNGSLGHGDSHRPSLDSGPSDGIGNGVISTSLPSHSPSPNTLLPPIDLSSFPSSSEVPSMAHSSFPSSSPTSSPESDPSTAPSFSPSSSPTTIPRCPERLSKSKTLDDDGLITLMYEVVLYPDSHDRGGLLCASLEYAGGAAGWIGLALSEARRNPVFGRREAVVGMPGIKKLLASNSTAKGFVALEGGPAFTNPGKYEIPAGGLMGKGYYGPSLTFLRDGDRQTLMDGSVFEIDPLKVNGIPAGQRRTGMTFTKYLREPEEIEIDPFKETLLLYAVAALDGNGDYYEGNPEWKVTRLTFLDSSDTLRPGYDQKRKRQHEKVAHRL